MVTAAEICGRFDLPSEAWPLLDESMAPSDFVEALVAEKLYVAGIDFLAHALAPREAIWWGGLCFQHVCGDEWSAEDKAAGRAAIQWVLDPTESHRAAAGAPATIAGPASAAGRLAMAVHQTDVEEPADAPSGPVDPFAPAKAVAGAVKLASIRSEPVRIADTQRLFVELGLRIGVAEGWWG